MVGNEGPFLISEETDGLFLYPYPVEYIINIPQNMMNFWWRQSLNHTYKTKDTLINENEFET